jgi:hypothetical protein
VGEIPGALPGIINPNRCYSESGMPKLTQKNKKASKLPRIAEIAQKLGKKIPETERRVIPQDFSSRLDHYIYGSTKR